MISIPTRPTGFRVLDAAKQRNRPLATSHPQLEFRAALFISFLRPVRDNYHVIVEISTRLSEALIIFHMAVTFVGWIGSVSDCCKLSIGGFDPAEWGTTAFGYPIIYVPQNSLFVVSVTGIQTESLVRLFPTPLDAVHPECSPLRA